MSQFSRPDTSTDIDLLPMTEAARQLRTEPYILRQWSRKFAPFLGDQIDGDYPRFNQC